MVDITSFQNNLSDTLSDSVLSIKEEYGHIILEIQSNAIVDVVTFLSSNPKNKPFDVPYSSE